MKHLFTFLTLIQFSFAQHRMMTIAAEIDDNLELEGVLQFEAPTDSDRLAISKWSAGKNKQDLPNMTLIEITQAQGTVEYQETEDWYVIGNLKAQEILSVRYRLDLKEINDWRKGLGYTVFTGAENQCWYPDVYRDGTRKYHKDFQVSIEYPSAYTVLTSGKVIQQQSKKGRSIGTFEANNILGYSLNMGLGYLRGKVANAQMAIHYFCPKEKDTTYQRIAHTALKAVDWYTSKYGFFPRKELGLAIGHPRWHGGFPAENLFFIHQGNTEEAFIQWITSHELGHYYWGLHVLSAEADDLSALMLANGIWIDHLYLSEAYEKSVVELWNTYAPRAAMIEKYLATYLANYEQEIGFPRTEQKFGFDYNSNIAHGKAAVGIYLLSSRIGTENFVVLQKELLQHYKNKPLGVAEYVNFLEKKGYGFARKFMAQWYKDHAMIAYDLSRIQKEQEQDRWNYTFEIRKKGTVDFPIEVTVVDQAGNTYTHITDGAAPKQVLTGSSKSEPQEFKLDVDGKVPMWNSDNAAIQRAYIFALFRAGKTKVARVLAEDYSAKNPMDERFEKLLERLREND